MTCHPLRPRTAALDILDQTRLPHEAVWLTLDTLEACARAIETMQVRGAPLIGATAAFGVALAMQRDAGNPALGTALSRLGRTRPTAVNLHWALARMQRHLSPLSAETRPAAAWREALAIHDDDIAANRAIGQHGLDALCARIARRPLRLMTHCNAGALATCGFGTALAPIYLAHAAGLPVEVWVSETRPRNQGLLTAWELAQAGVPHRLIADNAAGHLLQHGEVDAVIVGADRIAANGDTANKVGTLLKALAAQACGVPFFVAAPTSTLDPDCPAGAAIPIESRGEDELRVVHGCDAAGRPASVRISHAACANPAFDVTPAALITGIITERGLFPPARVLDALSGVPA